MLDPLDSVRLQLLANMKAALPLLQTLQAQAILVEEDGVYRFYHQSFKVHYHVQPVTEEIVQALQSLLPDRPFNKMFAEIIAKGTGIKFEHEHNRRWMEVTRPMLEAFWHARYFLNMACQFAILDGLPSPMPYGWAAMLYLFDLR